MISPIKFEDLYTVNRCIDSQSQTSTQEDENLYDQYQYNAENEFNQLNYGQFIEKNQNQDHRLTKSKVKSSLCKNFTQNGFCRYGTKCQFAHGTHQLRVNMDINNSYKTKPCNSFLKKGYCQYGYRCNFLHQEIQNTKQSNKWKIIYQNHRHTFNQIKIYYQTNHSTSRLMKIIKEKNCKNIQ